MCACVSTTASSERGSNVGLRQLRSRSFFGPWNRPQSTSTRTSITAAISRGCATKATAGRIHEVGSFGQRLAQAIDLVTAIEGEQAAASGVGENDDGALHEGW